VKNKASGNMRALLKVLYLSALKHFKLTNMGFTGKENHDISLATASEWTANYRATVPSTETIAHFFGRDAIQAILDQDDSVGIRIYYALDDAGEKQLIVCGANEDMDDLYQGRLAEKALRNPPYCGASNPLNS
jgi:hypothetical protein